MEPLPAFDAPAFQECKNRVREILAKNQFFQCAYCESPIENEPGRFHLDHMQPQREAPTRRFDITNLVASCQSNDTCGHRHKNFAVPEGLNPYRVVDLHLAFRCDSMGELHSAKLSDALQEFAFEKLNLNAAGLKTQRQKVISSLRAHTIASGSGSRKKLKKLSTSKTGFWSLFHQELRRFGFSVSS